MAVISVKIFCEPKYFLVSRIPRYTIISTSALKSMMQNIDSQSDPHMMHAKL